MPPSKGGISVSSSRLCDRLSDLGYDVDTYNLQVKVPASLHGVWQILNMLFLPVYVVFNKKYDIIHLHISCYWRRVILKIVRRLFKGAKTVVTIHGDVANFINYPLSHKILDSGDGIICVRPGNIDLLPEHLRVRARHIPAFIMPSKSEISRMSVPEDVGRFFDEAEKNGMPVIVFNGAVVLSQPFYDLYGFEDFTDAMLKLGEQQIKACALIIVNDMVIDSAKAKFLDGIERRLSGHPEIKFVKNSNFSLLPIFSRPSCIYVRPTKTDGDSLSLRESLAFGVPTIASDIAPRPEGTILYDLSKGSDELCRVLKTTVRNMETGSRTSSDGSAKDYFQEVVDVYESLLKNIQN